MLNTTRSLNGQVVAPHHLASQAGLRVLREGGTAVEAAIAVGAGPDRGLSAHEQPGRRRLLADRGTGAGAGWRGNRPAGLRRRPARRSIGSMAWPRFPGADPWPPTPSPAWSPAGTRRWRRRGAGAGGCPCRGCSRTPSPMPNRASPSPTAWPRTVRAKRAELAGLPGFAAAFLPDGKPPAAGDRLRQPALGASLRRLTAAGLDDFYRGGLAEDLAADLAALGSPVALADLQAHRARLVRPLSVDVEGRAPVQHDPADPGLRLADDPGPVRPPGRAPGRGLRAPARPGRSDQARLRPARPPYRRSRADGFRSAGRPGRRGRARPPWRRASIRGGRWPGRSRPPAATRCGSAPSTPPGGRSA